MIIFDKSLSKLTSKCRWKIEKYLNVIKICLSKESFYLLKSRWLAITLKITNSEQFIEYVLKLLK